MISLSRSRRPFLLKVRLVHLVLLAAAGLLPLSGCGMSCGAVGCLEGLNIVLDGSFDPGRTFQIEIAEVTTTPEVVRFMTCTLSPSAKVTGGQDLLCNSVNPHVELGKTIEIRDYQPKKIKITVSADGATLTEQTFEPMFTTREINGPGCGTCTGASIMVSTP